MDAAGKIKEENTMRINTNLTAMNTFNQVTKNQNKISSAVSQLSSGSAINSAADNAAGLAISEKMRAQIRGLDKASSNAQDAISLVQTAEGALNQSTSILQRMRELAVQSSSDTNQNDIDRAALQDEFSQLQKELDDISKNTTFNKKSLLDGSLAKTATSLSSADLKNSSLTVQLGNANAGNYNFSVSTKLESAAVEGKAATSSELVTGGAAGYFNNTAVTNGVSLGANAAESALLNGNYTLAAKYGTDGNVTVTATGDNGQTFSSTINSAALTNLATATGSALKLDMTFNADTNDAFKITVGLTSNIASTETNFNTLSENISKMTVSIAGGVTAKDAEYGVYANLTGADSVKLDSGMSSVTFDNGVKMNFDTLTASSVDTQNKATTVSVNQTAGLTNATAVWSNLSAKDDSAIANGNLVLKTDVAAAGTGVSFTATDANGVTYTATVDDKSTMYGASGTSTKTTLNFKDANGNSSFTMDYTATATGAVTMADDATGVKAYVTGAGHNYSKTFGDGATHGATIASTNTAVTSFNAAPTAAAFSRFSADNDSNVAAGSLTITTDTSAATTAGNVTFHATDAAGKTYSSNTVVSSTLLSTTASTAASNTLTFTDDNDATNVFTIQLDTTSTAAATQYFADDAVGTTVTVGNDLQASTKSDFAVESSANAGLTFQVGANEGDMMTINIERLDANYLGIASASVATQDAAEASIKAVDRAINQVSAQRAYLGAVQNRLEDKINNLNTSSENLTSAESQIRDVDMAKEMTTFTNANILSQASTAMLAQANSLPQSVLSLIGK
jgi:flagellin